MYICICYVYICVYVKYVCICVYVYLHICMYVCIYIYMGMYNMYVRRYAYVVIESGPGALIIEVVDSVPSSP